MRSSRCPLHKQKKAYKTRIHMHLVRIPLDYTKQRTLRSALLPRSPNSSRCYYYNCYTSSVHRCHLEYDAALMSRNNKKYIFYREGSRKQQEYLPPFRVFVHPSFLSRSAASPPPRKKGWVFDSISVSLHSIRTLSPPFSTFPPAIHQQLLRHAPFLSISAKYKKKTDFTSPPSFSAA